MPCAQDNSDRQYRAFRNGLAPLILLASAFLGLKHLYTLFARRFRVSSETTHLFLVPFLVTFSTAMLFALHGSSALKVYLILTANYALAKACGGSKAGPVLTWVFNALVLFGNDRYSGYSYAGLHPWLAFMVRLHPLLTDPADLTSYRGQDTWKGIYPRWYVSFNITMLRLVSFSMDYYWACNRVGIPDVSTSRCSPWIVLSTQGADGSRRQAACSLINKDRELIIPWTCTLTRTSLHTRSTPRCTLPAQS